MQLSPFQVNEALVRRIIENLVIECSSATQVVIKQDSMVGADDGTRVLTAASDLTLDITTSGKNGLDTGAEASDTWYYIYLILNPTTEEVAGLLSASATSPTLPSGFTKKRLVGAVRNDGSGDFRQFEQVGEKVHLSDDTRLFDSSVGSASVDCSSYVPALIAADFFGCFRAAKTGGFATGQEEVFISYVSGGQTFYAAMKNAMVAGEDENSYYEVQNGQQNAILYYYNSDANLNIQVDIRLSGFTLNL